MRLFLSAGEPSGDVHGANLIRSLCRTRPGVQCVGFGGERMAAAGSQLLYPLCQLAVMGIFRVLPSVPAFVRLLRQAERDFDRHRPDAVVLIDFPGFHWWLARAAHTRGIPVVYFVPPQLWGWASWRVRKMRRYVDHVLCNLPFEEQWYRDRGVPAHYIGHPYFDELTTQRLDGRFVADQQARGGTIIGLLPGSRTHEVEHNLATLLRAAGQIHAARPDTRFLVACFQASHEKTVRDWLSRHPLACVEPCLGRTPEIIHLSHSCMAVSGSVGLELLYQGKPSVVLYRVGPLALRVGRLFMNSPYISLVNLLAERELFPELLTSRCEAAAASGHVLRWLNDPAAYTTLRNELAALRERVAEPGACQRAAEYILRVAKPVRQAA